MNNTHVRKRVVRSDADISALITELATQDCGRRERAREALLALGKPSVAPLVIALSHRDRQVRWEAAKALADLCDPSAARALVAALGDERIGVRWLAAEGLIALGNDALDPLLRALLKSGSAALLGEGAHHVLHVLAKKKGGQWLTPLVMALDGCLPGVAVPLAAYRALEQLRAMSGDDRRRWLASASLSKTAPRRNEKGNKTGQTKRGSLSAEE